ncbi:hypothetical protein N9Y40_02840 [Porticoccaceae bacterium]|nr:hypothetical protein [Porticoccaceae bacterium]
MTISAYTGLPGSGKSYSVVKNVLIPALKDNRTVYTNIPLNEELVMKDFGYVPIQFTVDDILADDDYWNKNIEGGSVVVIDEVARLWKAGLKANHARECDAVFLQEHRHMTKDGKSLEVILVCQDLSQISSFVRTLVDRTYITVKLSAVGMDNRYRVDVYSEAQTRNQLKQSAFLSSDGGKYQKEVYQYYNSHTRGDGVGDETNIHDGFTIFKPWHFGAFALVVCFGFYLLYSFVSPFFIEDKLAANADNYVPSSGVEVTEVPVSSRVSSDFLDQVKSVQIVNNNSILGFLFKVDIAGGYSVMNVDDLAKFDIFVVAYNDCLVSLQDPDGVVLKYASCYEVEEKGLFSGLEVSDPLS